jgi:hypothetical protein
VAETPVAEQPAFVQRHRRQDEVAVLARAMREGIRVLYREALLDAYLLGNAPREQVLAELGPEALADVEAQRDALRRDVAWGLRDA